MGSVSIIFVLSSIEFHCCLAVSVVRVLVLGVGFMVFVLCCFCDSFAPFARSARFVASSWRLLLLRGSHALEQSPLPCTYRVVLCYCIFRLLCRHFLSFLHSSHSRLGRSAEIPFSEPQCLLQTKNCVRRLADRLRSIIMGLYAAFALVKAYARYNGTADLSPRL